MAVFKPTARHINLNAAMNMVAMKSTYMYSIYPSKEQKEIFNLQTFIPKEICNLPNGKPKKGILHERRLPLKEELYG
jgi:hypothetical protein